MQHNQLNHPPKTTSTNSSHPNGTGPAGVSRAVELSRADPETVGEATSNQTLLPTLWASWRWWLPPALISLILILKLVDPFIGDWDGLDYTILALRGVPSSMALGRTLFIFYNHALYVLAHSLFGLQPSSAYVLFKYSVVAQGPLAVIACWMLTRDLSRSFYAATTAALLIAFSPILIVYSGQVMTDVPAVLLLSVALIVHLRGLKKRSLGLVLLGAALLGAGVNLRETVGVFGPWLVLAPFVCGWKPGRREFFHIALSCVIFLVCSLAGFAGWFLVDPLYRSAWYGWRHSMLEEAARHPIGARNLPPFLLYFFVTAPLVVVSLPFAFVSEWRRRRLSPMLLLAAIGLGANLLLLLSYSTAIVWRYPLGALPALLPLSADFLMRTLAKRLRSPPLALASCAVTIVLLVVLFGLYIRPVTRQFIEWRALSKGYNTQLARLPRDAVMIAGAQTVAVTYWRGVGEGDWEVIGTGAGWPGDDQLVPTIENYLKKGRRVFVDADPRWWVLCSWQREEIPAIVKLESRFHFRHVFDRVYELRPNDDAAAKDVPHLELLLPENRPEEARNCPPGRR